MALEKSVNNAGTTALCMIIKKPFGTIDGRDVDLYTLTNSNGYEVKVTNFGGIVTSFNAPDRQGRIADIVLGFNDLAAYMKGHPYFGAIIGRYGNRIAKGQFSLEGKKYTLAQNNGTNNLHGGPEGFEKKYGMRRRSGSPASSASRSPISAKMEKRDFPAI